MFAQLDRFGGSHIDGEIELPALLAAARCVVEAADVLADRGDGQPAFFLDLAPQGIVQRLARFDLSG